jgi:disulfide bond formation protein DsbB
MTPLRPLLDRWPLFAAIASAAMLAVAHAFQTFGGLAPCALCYHQREVYWVALGVGLAGYLMSRFMRPAATRKAACAALALIFLFGAGLAAYHAGVEWKWWPGPTTCTGGPSGVDAGAMADLLKGKSVTAPSCDNAAWVWMGLSMAGWNALASLGLSAFSLAALLRRTRRG